MTSNQAIMDQTISLAGLAQSIRTVQHIAHKGQTNQADFKAVIASLLRLDAVSSAAVYGGTFELSSGLRVLRQQLDTSNRNKDVEFVGLAINLINQHKQLLQKPALLAQLSQRIKELSEKYLEKDFYLQDEVFRALLHDCSAIYQATLSTLSTRIQVQGEAEFLKPKENQMQVRAALLCAIRSVFLWRQSGGSRWHFLFKKKSLLTTLSELLTNPQKE